MNRKSLLGLLLFACVIITGLFAGADYLISRGGQTNAGTESYTTEEDYENITGVDASENNSDNTLADASDKASSGTEEDEAVLSQAPETATGNVGLTQGEALSIIEKEPWLSTNPTDMGASISEVESAPEATQAPAEDTAEANDSNEDTESTFTTSVNSAEAPQLINDSNAIDYKAYIPEMSYDSELEAALDISNPDIAVDAEAAILFDANTMEVLFYKNPVQAMFPASTAKLLTSLVALKWCKETDEVTIGDEITMIASDSTRAYLIEGQILTVRNLLEGMLLPSGNDAAYAIAAYVGRKSLDDTKATKEEAIAEFVRLMNEEAASLGVKNSCFKTPDGYDAVGQYTTAYDMGLIGVAAAKNSTILDVTQRSSSRNIFVSGEDVTWSCTNKLITRYSGQYYSKAIGLKTGTSSMAGRCLIAAAEYDGRKVVCVILDSTIEGRWEDAIALLKYGLD